MLASGCARSIDAELAKARAETEAGRADAAKARAEAETAKAALPKPVQAPAGPRIWRDTEAEELCKTLGIEADCFKYEGGWIACWVEIDVAGKKDRWGEDEEIHRTAALQNLFNEQVVGKPSGSLVWVRRSQNKHEAWDLAFKCKPKTSGGDTGSASKITLAPPDGPPQPISEGKRRLVHGDAEFALKEGQVVTLVTVENAGEKDGDLARSVKLQCKALK
jgi:hypothetical protein